MEIDGKPVLLYIIERLQKVLPLDRIVIATSAETSDDPIAAFCEREHIACHRGSLEHVAERFLEAGEAKGWDYTTRINGDNIFVDTDVLRDMIAIAETGQYAFISNVKDRTFPKGMSIEIVRTSVFRSLMPTLSASREYQEHVTLYLYDHEDQVQHYYFRNTTLPEAAGIQFALDTSEDFDRTSRIIAAFRQPHTEYNLARIYPIYQQIR